MSSPVRGLLASGKGRIGAARPPTGGPDALRRDTLAANAHLLVVAAGMTMPVAIYAAIHHVALPLVVALIALSTGFATLLLQLRGRHAAAAAGQVYAIALTGLILSAADPATADFGLAIALMAPIHAALLGSRALQRQAWIIMTTIVVAALFGADRLLALPDAYRADVSITGGFAFAVTALVVAYTGNRLNSAFEVYDKAQINAFRHLLEHVEDAVMRFSADGEVVFSSLTSEKLFGCHRYELTRGGLLERIHVLDRPALLTALADASHGARSRIIEVRVRDDARANGGAPVFNWLEISMSPVIESIAPDSNRPHEVVALFRDITDRRDQENEMRAARRAAEEASEAKSRFLATIGHELRTPLNAIVGFSEMMTAGIGGELSEAHREYADLIRRSGRHLIDVVSMLLDMSRIEAGKFELSADSFAPEDLLKPCLDMVDALARDKDIRFESRLAAGLPAIVADERACRQILINLLSNAIKFSHQGGVVVVTMKAQGAWLNLSVSDGGIGMTPEAVARVGEPFFQAQDGLSRRYEGTGLGLSIVKGLVDLHQGSVHVSSEPGAGTTMTVLLPINGPETKMPQTAAVMPLRREVAPSTAAPWPEQKRSAK